MITIITISKKPKLINYNNAPLTKANTLKKKKKKSSKLNKIEKEKKIWRTKNHKRKRKKTQGKHVERTDSISLKHNY